MRTGRFMIIVDGFTYKTKLTAQTACEIENNLRNTVNGIRIVPMPRAVG